MLRETVTENGRVRGLPGTDARITVFKGIRYAAAPVGKNRWRAPQPVENWQGVRDCFEFAPIAMQATPGMDPNAFYAKEWHVDPEVPMDEDCLGLNIWTNAKTGDERMPVFFWIHGGGLAEGYGHEMEFDGERFAARGIVLVSINYRLNVFGFLAHPELTAEAPQAPTNFGFLDQRAALEWVRRNIAAFGGDPDNITIGGQSSGGISVYKHMCAPGSRGLFQRAVIQSSAGGCVKTIEPKTFFTEDLTMAAAEELGQQFFDRLGVKTLAEARALDAGLIRKKYLEGPKFWPQAIDGRFVSRQNEDYLFGGGLADVPLMIGYTGDEMDLEIKDRGVINGNELSNRIIAAELTRQGRSVYCWDFDPTIPGDNAGAFHSSDLWFTFETLMRCWRPFDGHHFDLARRMCSYWSNFVKSGDPNGRDADGSELPQWKAYGAAQSVQLFFDEITPQSGCSPLMQELIDLNTKAYKNR